MLTTLLFVSFLMPQRDCATKPCDFDAPYHELSVGGGLSYRTSEALAYEIDLAHFSYFVWDSIGARMSGDDLDVYWEAGIWYLANLGVGVGVVSRDDSRLRLNGFIGAPIPLPLMDKSTFPAMPIVEAYYRPIYTPSDERWFHEFGVWAKLSTWP